MDFLCCNTIISCFSTLFNLFKSCTMHGSHMIVYIATTQMLLWDLIKCFFIFADTPCVKVCADLPNFFVNDVPHDQAAIPPNLLITFQTL